MIRGSLLSMPRWLGSVPGVLHPRSVCLSNVRGVSMGRLHHVYSNFTGLAPCRTFGRVITTKVPSYEKLPSASSSVFSTTSSSSSSRHQSLPNLSVSKVAYAVRYIVAHSSTLQSHFNPQNDPWAGYNTIRRRRNENLSAVLDSLISVDNSMELLLELVEKSIPGFSGNEPAEMLLSLLLCGCHTNPVVHKILALCKEDIGSMDIRGLMLLTRCMDLLPREDFTLVHGIVQRYKELLVSDKIPLEESVNAFCVVTKMMYKFISPTLLERFFDYLLRIVVGDVRLCLYSIETFVNIFNVSLRGNGSARKQIVNFLKKQLPDRISEFQPFHLKRLSTALQSQNLYDDTTRNLIDSQVLLFIKQQGKNLGIRDALTLFRSLTAKSDRALIEHLEGRIEKLLESEELDEHLTIQLGRSLYKVNSSNVKLVGLVQQKAAEYPVSVNLKISAFVTFKEFVETKHKEVLVDKFMTYIEDGHAALRLRSIYVLALMVPVADHRKTELLAHIPTWKFEELSLFLYGLMKWPYKEFLIDRRRKNDSAHGVHQVSEIFETVMENLIKKIDTSKTLAYFTAILAASNMKRSEQIYYTRQLMERFHDDTGMDDHSIQQAMAADSQLDIPVTSSIISSRSILSHVTATRRSLCDVVKFCTTARYFNAELCETLSRACIAAATEAAATKTLLECDAAAIDLGEAEAIEHAEEEADAALSSSSPTETLLSLSSPSTKLQYPLLQCLFSYLGVFSYTPSNAADVLAAARWLLSEFDKANNLHYYLRTMTHLASSGRIVPVDLLASVFTTDFLARLNEYLRHNPDQKKATYCNLAFLNQVAVVDYPHLRVPWFLGEIVEKIGHVPNKSVYLWDNVLRQVLGDSCYYKTFTRSPVGHHIDFELLTDAKTNKILSWESNLDERNIRRHAILIEPERYFCMVRAGELDRRLGRRQKTVDHLRKLGYSVLEMPGQEWPERRSGYETYFWQKLEQANIKMNNKGQEEYDKRKWRGKPIHYSIEG